MRRLRFCTAGKVLLFTLPLFTVPAGRTLYAADDPRLALALKAQTDFDRVELAALPQLRDVAACIQSQASVLPVTAHQEVSLIHYRKGYCALASATITGASNEFSAAATEFDLAIESWPVPSGHGNDALAQPVSPALRVLASVARLKANPDAAAMERAQKEISSAINAPVCSANIMSALHCQSVLDTGRLWLGWIALRHDELEAAARYWSAAPSWGWSSWVAGRMAFRRGDYVQAESEYRKAVDAFQRADREAAPLMNERLRPKPDLSLALEDLGGAQILTHDAQSAIATLSDAIQANASDAYAIYLRARARDVAGLTEPAKSDYNLASRTAFANAQDLASGEAHLYRGILLYREKNLSRAEDEFSSALNFEIPAGMRPDAVAWRYLTAVAGGACGASRDALRKCLASVSPYFPKDEATSAITTCSTAGF